MRTEEFALQPRGPRHRRSTGIVPTFHWRVPASLAAICAPGRFKHSRTCLHGARIGGVPRPCAYSARIASTRRLRSEEHTSELQSLMRISYAVFCFTKKNIKTHTTV